MTTRFLKHSFSLLHLDYVKLNQHWNFPNVISPYLRIYYIDDGEGYVIRGDVKTKLESGYLYLIPSFTLCHLTCDKYLSQYFLHFFEESSEGISLFEHNRTIIKVLANQTDVENFKRLLVINPGRGINRSDNPKIYEKNAYYRGYQELNNNVTDATYFETQGIIMQLLSRFLGPNWLGTRTPNAIPSKIMEAISYIQLNLNEKITVSSLAQKANLDKDYFSRLFFKFTGERPLTYLQTKRIERAQYLMATTNLSYKEISEQAGFEAVSHFSRIFKKITDLTPREYKKRNELIYSNG